MAEVLQCEEFGEIALRIGSLLNEGELRLDERIASKGYLSAAMRGGQVVFRATKYVGTIPLTPDLSVMVRPRATITNLSYMLVRSGVIPNVIPGFSRGYMPRFIPVENVEKIYGRTLVDGAQLIARRGFMKEYIRPSNPAPWRGRLMVSDTVKRYAARGVRYKHDFDHSTLSSTTVENVALKEALGQVKAWFLKHDERNAIVKEISNLLHDLWPVASWRGRRSDLVSKLGQRIRVLPPKLSHYRDPLWAALLVLQNLLPEVAFDGFVRLDSMIIDVSKVFEAFLRRELAIRLSKRGYLVEDGNKRPGHLFRDGGPYSVHPDFVVRRNGIVVALLDAKYKPDPKEQDRYELLSFMDAFDVKVGGFICPSTEQDVSRYLGTTESEKQIFSLRYDLATADPDMESDRFAENVVRMIEGSREFL